jgi:sugar lactone lactonase YvrE
VSARAGLVFAFASLLAAGALTLADQDPAPLRLEAGGQTYEWVRGFGRRPEGKPLGNTHGCVVVDRDDQVYLCTDTEDAVVVFDRDGNVVRTFGRDLGPGLHGLALVEEEGRQFLLLAHLGGRVLKCTLAGEVLWSVGYPEESGLYDKKPEMYRPTSVAPLPDGGFLVADGYGKSWIHRYDRERKYVKSFGGPGTELGKLRTPHGIWVETRAAAPELYVADRENNRLQVFDLDGKPLREVKDVEGDLLRRPCHIHPGAEQYVVADLAGRVTLLDRGLGLIGHLGDNPDPGKRARNDVLPAEWRDGEFISPHCAAFDSRGDLYVTDWVSAGRISKLRRVP